jgi:electron transfer flavoprotein beta subunit
MDILLVVAGILDPKWPLPRLDGQSLPARASDKMILSPFEEAALELALRLRDSNPEIKISALVCGAETEKLAFAIGSYRIENVTRLAFDFARFWDTPALAAALAEHIKKDSAHDLIFLGREVGDCDDGLLAPLLAAQLDRRFFGLAQDVRTGADAALMRERAGFAEWTPCASGLVVSVTNDRRNRLRRPLMKNVQEAKRRAGALAEAATPVADARIVAVSERASARRKMPCRMLSGALEAQVAELADTLKREKAA